MSTMTPAEIVSELDKHIIGQGRAKKAVAVALRNRWRRQQVGEPLRQEITPKNILMPTARPVGFGASSSAADTIDEGSSTRQTFRKRLREGLLDDKEVELDIEQPQVGMDIMGPPGMEDMTEQIRSMFANLGGGKKQRRKLKVKEALKLLTDEEAGKMLNDEEVKTKAVQNVEQNGIVFLDEIDKIASRNEAGGGEVSRQGVQRDLLPLVEGTTINTKYGMVKTDHILFIASGAFHLTKPSDLIPELQGRFPIRVELGSLSVDDFEAILTQTHANLVRQYQALLATEGVQLEFTNDGVARLAQIAFAVNEKTENIGARRLYTVMEKLLEQIAFSAGNASAESLRIDASYVDERLAELARNEDLARYVL